MQRPDFTERFPVESLMPFDGLRLVLGHPNRVDHKKRKLSFSGAPVKWCDSSTLTFFTQYISSHSIVAKVFECRGKSKIFSRKTRYRQEENILGEKKCVKVRCGNSFDSFSDLLAPPQC